MFYFTIMRYSLLSKTGAGYGAARRLGLEEYRRTLFAPDRMAMRLRLLKTVTLPSLAHQSPALARDQHRVLIYTSDDLPSANRQSLMAAVADYDWVEVHTITGDDTFGAACRRRMVEILRELFPEPREVPYATLRLDDDDALARRFYAALKPYVRLSLKNHGVSMGRGFGGWMDDEGRFIAFRPLVFPNLALGLAHIGGFHTGTGKFSQKRATIYELGNHMHLPRKVPVILDCSRPRWIRTIYRGQDSATAERNLFSRSALADIQDVRKVVYLSDDALPN